MAPTVLHIRSETRPLERRSVISPVGAKELIEAGYRVNVERSPDRCFPDSDFEDVGATLVAEDSWPNVSTDHIILGLKELPEDGFPLKHAHVYFGHDYKNPARWQKLLSRFRIGGGALLDLEFFQEPGGRLLAPSGYHAGYAGAALALKAWGHQIIPGDPLPSVTSYRNDETLMRDVQRSLFAGIKYLNRIPKVIVFGARGHCGTGAVDLCILTGIPAANILQWNRAETENGGPFREAIESDILINCIYLDRPTPPFIDLPSLESPYRKLSIICDVSCDLGDPNNPLPIYSDHTTFEKPTIDIPIGNGRPVRVISIDHLPNLIPRQATEACSRSIMPMLKQLNTWKAWYNIDRLFLEKIALLPTMKDRLDKGINQIGMFV